MRYPLLLLALLLAAAPLWTAPAAAAELENLYAAAVPVPDQSDAARAQGLRSALADVLVRVSGDPAVAQRAGAAAILDQAQSLVQQYGYRERAPETNGGDGAAVQQDAAAQPEPQLMLRAVFDDDGVDQALRQAGLPVWGRERPRTLVWLALEAAEAPMVTQAGPEAVLDSLQGAAQARGLPLRFPAVDEAEAGRVTASDITSGNSARLLAVSRGYGVSHVLIGSASAAGGAYSARWRLLDDGRVLAAWRDDASSREALLTNAVGHAADVFAAQFATAAGGGDGIVVVGVSGVDDAEGYTRVSRYLADMSAVSAVAPVVIDGAAVVFRVRLNGGAGVLDRNIGLSGWLVSDPTARSLASLHADSGEALGYRVTP